MPSENPGCAVSAELVFISQEGAGIQHQFSQRRIFSAEFRELLAARYGRKLDDYGDEQVDVLEARRDPGGDVTVRTRIHRRGSDEVTVDYRLRFDEGRFRAIDVVIEGVSLVFSYRGQFQEILSEGGPAGLIERVREKNAAQREGGEGRDPLPDP